MGVKPQRIEMEWPADKVIRALDIVIDEQPFSALRKRVMKKKLVKLLRQGRLDLSSMDTEWLYRLCCASLMLHDYHWFAWEWRSEWASLMATQPWVWPQWDGTRAKVLVVAEQGIGDEIVFASCYHDLAADVEEAWIEVDPRLIPIFERSFPENLHFVDRFVHAGKNIVPRPTDYPKIREGLPIEAFIMAGNVPKLYRQGKEDFRKYPFGIEGHGFLKPNLDLMEKWNLWTSTGFALQGIFLTPRKRGRGQPIGCSWKGRQGEIKPVENGVSLQYGTEDHHGLMVPPIDLKRDLEDVFMLIAGMNHVVTTTNAVAHMAGALGVPTDVIKPPPIWATKEDGFNNRVSSWWPEDFTDWYPSIRMFRNQQEWRAKQ